MGSPKGCCVPHMLQVLSAARRAKLRVFYALHHRYRPGDYESWKCIAPIQSAALKSKAFEYGTWGGEIRREFEPQPREIVVFEHWCSSGFANTDLDLQLKNTASISSSSSTHSTTPVSRRVFVMPLSLATKSRW